MLFHSVGTGELEPMAFGHCPSCLVSCLSCLCQKDLIIICIITPTHKTNSENWILIRQNNGCRNYILKPSKKLSLNIVKYMSCNFHLIWGQTHEWVFDVSRKINYVNMITILKIFLQSFNSLSLLLHLSEAAIWNL